MKSWFLRHPHVAMLACASLSLGSFVAAVDAYTAAGRVWLYFCSGYWGWLAIDAWERT